MYAASIFMADAELFAVVEQRRNALTGVQPGSFPFLALTLDNDAVQIVLFLFLAYHINDFGLYF